MSLLVCANCDDDDKKNLYSKFSMLDSILILNWSSCTNLFDLILWRLPAFQSGSGFKTSYFTVYSSVSIRLRSSFHHLNVLNSILQEKLLPISFILVSVLNTKCLCTVLISPKCFSSYLRKVRTIKLLLQWSGMVLHSSNHISHLLPELEVDVLKHSLMSF